MIKKIVIITSLLISSLSYSEITDSKFNFVADQEYKDMNIKMFHIELGDVRTDFIKEIEFVGQKWYLLDEVDNLSYYIQKDPLTNKISRIRIVYPFTEFESGRDIKHLTEIYGKPEYISNHARFHTDNIRIRMYVDKDVLTEELEDNKTIIDILNYKVNAEKEMSEDTIYKSNRMIRH